MKNFTTMLQMICISNKTDVEFHSNGKACLTSDKGFITII